MNIACISIALVLMLALSPTSADAIGGDSGGTGGGGTGGGPGFPGGYCCVPEDLEGDAKRLFEQLSETALNDILVQQFAGSICKNFICGALDEGQASRLVDRYVAQSERAEDRWQGRANLVFAGLATFFAGLATLISWLAYRLSREADRRSVRNEVEIGHIRETLGKVPQGG